MCHLSMKQQADSHSRGEHTLGSDDDDLEFATFAQDQDPVDVAAATWAVSRRAGLSTREEAALQAWLTADSRHSGALDEMDALLGDVQQLPDEDVASLKARLNTREQASPGNPTPAANGRSIRYAASDHHAVAGWRWHGGLAQAVTACATLVCIAAGWVGWQHWQGQPVFEQTYATMRGEQLKVTLPDAEEHGTFMQMDAATQTSVQLFRDHRDVVLEDGQAMFIVHPDKQRPFHVLTGNMRITVVGTRFSVRHTQGGLDAGRTVVMVEQGHVQVARNEEMAHSAAGDSSPARVDLTAGQMVVADADGRLGRVSNISPSAVAIWREERLSFEQTPLAQVIAEYERYGYTDLVVRDPAVAALPVGGSYSLKQFQRFVEDLPKVLPVRLVKHGNVTEVAARPEPRN